MQIVANCFPVSNLSHTIRMAMIPTLHAAYGMLKRSLTIRDIYITSRISCPKSLYSAIVSVHVFHKYLRYTVLPLSIADVVLARSRTVRAVLVYTL